MSLDPVILKRGVTLAELFFADLQPGMLFQAVETKTGAEYIAVFVSRTGRRIAITVTVLVTLDSPDGSIQLRPSSRECAKLTDSNTPFLLLVADAKHTKVWFGWVKDAPELAGPVLVRTPTITVPLKEATPRNIENLRTSIITAGV